MDINKNIFPFNNVIETGFRTLCILAAVHPRLFDIETLVCLDYLCVHSGDFESGIESLHPANPNRAGEIYVRRNIIEQANEIFIQKKLLLRSYQPTGIEYMATELAGSFLDMVTAGYSLALINRADWVSHKIQDLSNMQIQALVKNLTNDYSFQIFHP